MASPPRDAADIANELYVRGFTLTREQATHLVAQDAKTVAILLGLPSPGAEMRHDDDRADWREWGHADPGSSP